MFNFRTFCFHDTLHFADATVLTTPERTMLKSLVNLESELFILLCYAVHFEGSQKLLC